MKNVSDDSQLLHRESNGVLRDNFFNSRVVILSCSAYQSMCEALYDQFQTGAGIILYRMGEGYGSKLVKGVRTDLSPEEKIEHLSKLSHLAGWGTLIINLNPGGESEAIVEGGAFLLRRKNIGPSTCYFMSGVLAGAASELLGGEYKAQEMKCASNDDTGVCKFKIVAKLS